MCHSLLSKFTPSYSERIYEMLYLEERRKRIAAIIREGFLALQKAFEPERDSL
jgi:hypothetical protein